MSVCIARMKRVLKKFNKHAYTLEDVYRICKRERINIVFFPMIETVRGYYQIEPKNVYRKKFICINENLSKSELLEVLLHELVHHFLHATTAFKRQIFYCRLADLNDAKQDLEADIIALIMEIPKDRLLELMATNSEHLTEFNTDKMVRRVWVYREHGE